MASSLGERNCSRGQQAGGVLPVRLHDDGLKVEEIETPSPDPGEVLVRVYAAAITRDELEWPVDRLPAIPSYELSGMVAALGPDVSDLPVGEAVWALTGFDRDGAAAEYAVVPASFLAPKPRSLGHLECAAIPLAGLTAWQGLFEHGRLRKGERVLIHGAAGGVGQFATQLARWHGAHVIGTASGGAAVEDVLALGGNEIIDRAAVPFEKAVSPVDLVFDTVGGETVARSAAVLREREGWSRGPRSLELRQARWRRRISSSSPAGNSSSSLPGWSMRTSSEPSSTPPSLSLTPRRRSSESWAPASAARS